MKEDVVCHVVRFTLSRNGNVDVRCEKWMWRTAKALLCYCPALLLLR